MGRDELRERVNDRAKARYGGSVISPDSLYDLLESKLVIAPAKHGRARDWSAHEYRQLLEIARLNWLGTSIHSEIRWMFWLKRRLEAEMTFNLEDRAALARRYDQNIGELFKKVRSTYPHVTDPGEDGWPARSVIRKMGPLDESLTGVVTYERQELLGLYQVIRFAEPLLSTKLVMRIAAWIAGRWKIDPGRLRGPDVKAALADAASAVSAIGRYPGTSRSIVANSILRASPENFAHARRLLDLAIRIFRRLGLGKAANSLLHPKWRLTMLAAFVHLSVLSAKNGGSRWLPEVGEIDAFERNSVV